MLKIFPARVKLPSLATVANAFNCHRVMTPPWIEFKQRRLWPIRLEKSSMTLGYVDKEDA
jgi:hypothetical protein